MADNIHDPFFRATKSNKPSKALPTLGESTDIADTSMEDAKRLQGLVPEEATTEEGFNRMMSILGYSKDSVPKDTKDPSVPNPDSYFNSNSVFASKSYWEDRKKQQQQQKEEEAVAPTPTPVLKENASSIPAATKESTQENKKDDDKSKSAFKDEDVLPILDSLLTRGYASEKFTIRKDLELVVRCQFLWEDRMVMEKTDAKLRDYSLRTTGNFFYDIYSLAANLEQFGGTYFAPIKAGSPKELEESFNDRVEFIETLPSPIITLIALKRIEFLQKLSFVIENFDRLLKAF